MPILKAINTGNGFSAACRVEEIVGKRNTLAEQGWAIQVGLYPDLESAREGRGLLWQLYPTCLTPLSTRQTPTTAQSLP